MWFHTLVLSSTSWYRVSKDVDLNEKLNQHGTLLYSSLNWNLLIKTNINLNRPVVHWKIVRHMRDGGSWHSSHGWFHTGKIRSLSNKSIIAEVTIPAAVTIPSVITPVGNDHFTAPHWNICPKAARLPEYRF